MEKNPTVWREIDKVVKKFIYINSPYAMNDTCIYIYIYIYKFSEGHAFEKARLIGLEVCRKQGMIQNLSR